VKDDEKWDTSTIEILAQKIEHTLDLKKGGGKEGLRSASITAIRGEGKTTLLDLPQHNTMG